MVLGFIFGILYLFSDFFYWAKWAASIIALHLWRRIHRRRFDLYDFEADYQPEKLGILVPPEEKILESPFPDEHLNTAADEIFVYGVNSQSESLVVRLSRAPNDLAEAWILLKMKDGRWYELQDKVAYQRNYGGKCTSFTCGGLQMHYLSPMRRWRIFYCGMLRERTKQNENEGREVFVKFTFIWRASSDVFDSSSDFHIRTAADAMANAKWTSIIPPVKKMSSVLNFYCQSGVMSGTVSIEDESETEMYLFGERIRHLSKSSLLVGAKFKYIFGVIPGSGLVVHLGRGSAPNIFQNLNFGFIVHPDTFIHVIEDGVIISRMSGDAESREDVTATFKAGRQYELHGNFVDDGIRLTSGNGWDGYLKMNGIDFEIDGLKGNGFLLSGEVFELPKFKCQKVVPTLPITRPLTVSFTEEASHSSELTGGKGASLGMLTKFRKDSEHEFVVPKGIVVTTTAYQEFLTPDLISKIDKLKNTAYGNIYGNVQEACKTVITAIEQADLPDNICQDVKQKLQQIFGDDINHLKVAVRSSAIGEDTDQISAAGQMSTFLGVQGLKEIFNAVKKCWASQFSYTATEYKRQNGQIIDSPMAVVIQEMVECDAAGVLFTCDPVTNNTSVTVITGNYGLGESVVSGSEEPDTIVLKKLPMDEVEIQSVHVGLKQRKIVLKDTNSTEGGDTVMTEEIPDNERHECCISLEMAKRLGKLASKIENYFKSPRDIEWGIKGESIYILQSRPITTGAATSDYEIKHEFDGPLRSEGDFFTICNVGEALPGAASPLGIDVSTKYFGAVFKKKVMYEGKKQSFNRHKYFASGMVPFCNHLTLNIVDMLTQASDLESSNAQSMMIGIFGRILDDPELKTLTQYKEIKHSNPGLKFLSRLLWNLFFSGYGIEEIRKEMFDYQVPAETAKTARDAFDLIMQHSYGQFPKPCIKHMICSGMSSMWNLCMFNALASSKGCIDTDVYSDFAKLLSTQSNVESADIPSAIKQLANWLNKDAKREDFKSMSVEDALEWLQTSNSSAGTRFRKFIQRHGHRCIKELDIYAVPWRVDPKPLIKLLQNMVCSGEEAPEKQGDDTSTIFSKLTVPMNLKTKLLLRFLLTNCRRGVREREICKSILVKSMDNVKKGFRHLSKAMVAEGYLPDSDLMYFLTIDEIQDVLETRNSRLIARANHRRKLYPTLDKYMFPDIWKGLPVPQNDDSNEEVEYVADLMMKGIPVSQGTVKGYARVALSLEEAAHLKRGEILITYSTDIAWSPYFPLIAGVVTELGGLISHGAVVSREYGLPCVVGIHGATKMFKTGDFVLLDGNKGILQRLTSPESS